MSDADVAKVRGTAPNLAADIEAGDAEYEGEATKGLPPPPEEAPKKRLSLSMPKFGKGKSKSKGEDRAEESGAVPSGDDDGNSDKKKRILPFKKPEFVKKAMGKSRPSLDGDQAVAVEAAAAVEDEELLPPPDDSVIPRDGLKIALAKGKGSSGKERVGMTIRHVPSFSDDAKGGGASGTSSGPVAERKRRVGEQRRR